MQYWRPFTYLFRQPHAVSSLAVGSVLMLVPVVGQIAVFGWVVTAYRALIEGRQDVSPLRFSDFSRLLQVGMGPWLVRLVVSLLVYAVVGPVFGLLWGLGSALLPLGLAVLPFDEGVVALVALGLMLATGLVLGLAVAVATMMVVNAALIRAELASDVGGAFSGVAPSSLWRTAAPIHWELFKASLMEVVGGALFVSAGMLCLYFGMIPAMVVAVAAGAHFRAQLYGMYLARGGAALPISPLPGAVPGVVPTAGAPVPYGGAPAPGGGVPEGLPPPGFGR